MPDDLFTSMTDPVPSSRAGGSAGFGADAPLPVRMRPRELSEVVGQDHLLETGSPLRRLVETPGSSRSVPSSVVLWGPPGTGKTTLAYLLARSSGREFVELSAVLAGVKEVRSVIDAARRTLAATGRETILFIDEVHRFNKSQQDALLPSVENRWVTLVAATTENPYFSINSPLLSRSLVLTLESLGSHDLGVLLERAVADDRGFAGEVSLSDSVRDHLVRLSSGDARRALTALEAAAGAVLAEGKTEIGVAELESAMSSAAIAYDREGDAHYDIASAFIKSMRGSDPDASLHYLARMIQAGEDPRFIARRIVIAASEEVGMADPTALQVAVAAAQAVQLIGMPEARITLSQAVVHIATAPKSNAAYLAINAALADVRSGLGGRVPASLRDTSYRGATDLGHGAGYIYAHDAPHGIAAQQYAPDDVAGRRYYEPTTHGRERELGDRLNRIRASLGRRDAGQHDPGREAATRAAPAVEAQSRTDAGGKDTTGRDGTGEHAARAEEPGENSPTDDSRR